MSGWTFSDNGILFPDDTVLSSGFISRADNPVINGAMEVDQVNVGASVTVNTTGTLVYSVDMFSGVGTSSAGVFSLQQMSDTPPAGFKNYLRAKVTTADATPASGSTYALRHAIEGNWFSRFSFGTAGAKTVTMPVWVRSSVAGTFGGSIRNGAANRSYPFSYTIASGQVNTWVPLSITLVGDTTGTWITDGGIGCIITFDLGSGSSLQGTANTWAGANYYSVTGATRLINTVNATLDFTGLDFLEGTKTRPYPSRTEELYRCQRYLPVISAIADQTLGHASYYTSTTAFWYVPFKVKTRAPITGLNVTAQNTINSIANGAGPYVSSAITLTTGSSIEGAEIQITTAAAVANAAALLRSNGASKFVFTGAQL